MYILFKKGMVHFFFDREWALLLYKGGISKTEKVDFFIYHLDFGS